MDSMSKKTPFYKRHVALGAKMHDFAGYIMPISYTGISQEHNAVRNAAGVFDVSHMGEFLVQGKKALDFLQYITINDVSSLEDGQAQYSAMCYPDGGIVDDLLIYRFDAEKYMMVVNASNIEKDFAWAREHLLGDVILHNESDQYALLAVQGPGARDILQALTDVDLKDIPFYHFREGLLADTRMIISRTGYTGEPGFELYHSPADSLHLWDALFASGKTAGLQPVGLAARDTLRLEMKYALYGHEIDRNTNPLEAGLGWITKLDKDDFIGKDALLKIKGGTLSRRLVALKLLERGIPRQGYGVHDNDKAIGTVTSGTMSPTLGIGIATAYVEREYAKSGNRVLIDIRGKMVPAQIVKPPFVDTSPF
jgi:aminomethyltransferase